MLSRPEALCFSGHRNHHGLTPSRKASALTAFAAVVANKIRKAFIGLALETCKFTVEFRVPIGAERLHVIVTSSGCLTRRGSGAHPLVQVEEGRNQACV